MLFKNPMSTADQNEGLCWILTEITITNWQLTRGSIDNSVRMLKELIDIKDGYKECILSTNHETDESG